MANTPIAAFDVFVLIAFRGAKTSDQVRQQRKEFLRDYGRSPDAISELDAAQIKAALTRHVLKQWDAPRLASAAVRRLAKFKRLKDPALQQDLEKWLVRRVGEEAPARVQALLNERKQRLIQRSNKERSARVQKLRQDLPARAAE